MSGSSQYEPYVREEDTWADYDPWLLQASMRQREDFETGLLCGALIVISVILAGVYVAYRVFT